MICYLFRFVKVNYGWLEVGSDSKKTDNKFNPIIQGVI